MNLEIRSGPEEGRVVGVGDAPVVIGRDNDCDIVLDDPAVSRKHADVSVKDGVLTVSDNDSANGVSVNHIKVDGSAELASGDLITVGPLALFVLYKEPAEHAFVTSKADTQSVPIYQPRENFKSPTTEAQIAELAAKAEPGLSVFGMIVIAVIAICGIILIVWLVSPSEPAPRSEVPAEVNEPEDPPPQIRRRGRTSYSVPLPMAVKPIEQAEQAAPIEAGSLTIVTVPSGLTVMIDDQQHGVSEPDPTAPYRSLPVTVNSLAPGQHAVTLAYRDERSATREVELSADRGEALEMTMWLPDTVVNLTDGSSYFGMQTDASDTHLTYAMEGGDIVEVARGEIASVRKSMPTILKDDLALPESTAGKPRKKRRPPELIFDPFPDRHQ
jgi:hypothetical protein